MLVAITLVMFVTFALASFTISITITFILFTFTIILFTFTIIITISPIPITRYHSELVSLAVKVALADENIAAHILNGLLRR